MALVLSQAAVIFIPISSVVLLMFCAGCFGYLRIEGLVSNLCLNCPNSKGFRICPRKNHALVLSGSRRDSMWKIDRNEIEIPKPSIILGINFPHP